MAKAIVVCGFHANEDAGIRICKEWDSKKKGDVYTELSELAGRKITEKEVELVNVSRHTHHALVKEFAQNWPLEKLIALYDAHSEKLPEDYKRTIKEYSALWKQYKKYFPLWRWQKEGAASHEAFKELEEKYEKLAKKVGTRFFGRVYTEKDIIYPKELYDFTHQPSNDARALVAKLKKDLEGIVVIDLHSTPANKQIRRRQYSYCYIRIAKQKISGPWHKKIFSWYRQEKGARELAKRLGKHAEIEGDIYETDEYPFSHIAIELYHSTIEEKNTAEFYRWFYKYPSFQFMLWLTRLFGWKETFEPSIAICTDRLGFCDPAYYYSKDYAAAKRFIASVIKEALEWSEKYQAI